MREDRSCNVKIGVTGNAFYVLDVWCDRVEFPALLRRVKQAEYENFPPSGIYVEDASNGIPLISQLKVESPMAIIPITAKGSKEARSRVARESWRPGACVIRLKPRGCRLERELLSFPAGKHDEQVDAFTLALSQVMQPEPYGDVTFWGEGGVLYEPTPAIDGNRVFADNNNSLDDDRPSRNTVTEFVAICRGCFKSTRGIAPRLIRW